MSFTYDRVNERPSACDQEFGWYVLQTYSGYEDKVASSIITVVEDHNLKSFIDDIRVPREEIEEVKDGKRRTVMRKIFLGYVFIKMVLIEDLWRLLTSIRGCVGFAGNPYDPVPLTRDECEKFGIEKEDSSKHLVLPYKINDVVQIIAGELRNVSGTVSRVDLQKECVTVKVSMFKREVSIDLKLEDVVPVV